MWDAPAPRLAVAVLTESGGTSAAYRHRPDRPVQGYCLITGDERQYRMSLYLRNGRALTGRSVHDRFYYECWALTEKGPVSMGAFNTGDSGDGNGAFTRSVDGQLLERAARIRVTAEPFGGSQSGHTPVLEGQLAWIQGKPDSAAAELKATADTPAPWATEPTPAAEAHTPWAGLLAGAGQPVATLPRAEASEKAPEERAEPNAVLTAQHDGPAESEPEPEPEPEDLPAVASEPTLEPTSEPEPEPEPEQELDLDQDPEPLPDGPAVHPFKLREEPAVLVTAQSGERKVALRSTHPMAPRAGGSALLLNPNGGLQLTLWGLPSPAALGREKSTNRPYNTYRVWLQNQRTGQRAPLGLCTRLWGENYRFALEEPLPTGGYDTVLVTAHDRSAESPDPNVPQVVTGALQ